MKTLKTLLSVFAIVLFCGSIQAQDFVSPTDAKIMIQTELQNIDQTVSSSRTLVEKLTQELMKSISVQIDKGDDVNVAIDVVSRSFVPKGKYTNAIFEETKAKIIKMLQK